MRPVSVKKSKRGVCYEFAQEFKACPRCGSQSVERSGQFVECQDCALCGVVTVWNAQDWRQQYPYERMMLDYHATKAREG